MACQCGTAPAARAEEARVGACGCGAGPAEGETGGSGCGCGSGPAEGQSGSAGCGCASAPVQARSTGATEESATDDLDVASLARLVKELDQRVRELEMEIART